MTIFSCKEGPLAALPEPWSPKRLAEYFNSTSRESINKTEFDLGDNFNLLVQPPDLVAQIDWSQLFSTDYVKFPQASSKFCQVMASGAYWDFKVETKGFSSWHYVHSGEVKYYFVDSPGVTLEKGFKRRGMFAFSGYQPGEGKTISPLWRDDFFVWGKPDMQLEISYTIRKWCVTLKAGQALFIPSGWLHASSATADSIVFGGRFLNYYSVKDQIFIHDLEQLPPVGGIYWHAAAHLLENMQRILERSALALGGEMRQRPQWLSSALVELSQFFSKGRYPSKEPFPEHGLLGYESSKRLLEELKKVAGIKPIRYAK